MYEKLYKKYEFYTIEENIIQYKHEFDTQIDEEMNAYVARYTPKIKHYSKPISLEARVKILIGIYNCGYHFFWTEVMNTLHVDVSISLKLQQLQCDKIILRNILREHDHANIAKRKNNEHIKIRKDLEKRFKDIAKNVEYGSQIGCKEGDGKPDEKKEGGEKIKKRKKTDVKIRKHRAYCCTIDEFEKKKHHLTEVSKHCVFNSKSKEKIVSTWEKFLSLITILEMSGIGKLLINWYNKYGTF